MHKLIPLCLLLAACQYTPMLPGLTPHQIDIQQGNFVDQDMIAKLKPGMSRSQVRFALGTPLVNDPFHPDRWDYVYVLQKKGRVVEHRRIAVVFEGEKLARIEGDVKPGGNPSGGAAIDPKLSPSAAAGASPAK